MSEAWTRIWAAIARIFSGIEHYAGAFEQTGKLTEDASRIWSEEVTIGLESRRHEAAQRAKQQAALFAEEA